MTTSKSRRPSLEQAKREFRNNPSDKSADMLLTLVCEAWKANKLSDEGYAGLADEIDAWRRRTGR